MTDEQRDEVLVQLHEDLQQTKHQLMDLKEQIIEADVSNYPIFVATEFPIDLGKKVLDKFENELHWHYNASHLEEFYAKKVVLNDKLADFKKLYKEHTGALCLFVIHDEEGDFVFLNPKANRDEF